MIRYLPKNTSVEDIYNRLVALGFDVISVKQMSATHWSPEETTFSTLTLVLVT